MITVRGPGRCTACSFHVATQGHREGCDGTAPVAPDLDPEWGRLGFVERLAHRAVDDPAIYSRGNGQLQQKADRLRVERDGNPQPKQSPATGFEAPGANPTYTSAAIRAELQRLASATEGTRNDTLHRTACAVFGFVKGGHANGTATRAELERIAVAIGLEPSEIRATLRSAWRRVEPRRVPAPRGAVV